MAARLQTLAIAMTLLSACSQPPPPLGPPNDAGGPLTIGPALPPDKFFLAVGAPDGGTLTLPATGTTTLQIDVRAVEESTGNVSLAVNGFPPGTWGTIDQYYPAIGTTVTLTAHSFSALPASGAIQIKGGNVSGSQTVALPISVAGGTTGATGTTGGDFAVAFEVPDGGSFSIPTTGTATALIDLTAIEGFAGDVNLAVNGFPTGTWGTLSSYYAPVGTPVTLSANAAAAAPGSATIQVTASGSSGTHTASIPLTVVGPTGVTGATGPTGTTADGGTIPDGGSTADAGATDNPGDFSINIEAPDGGALTLASTDTTTATINLTGIDGFTGDVGLTVNGFPTGTWGTLSNYYAPVGTPVTLTANSASTGPTSATITVTGSGPAGMHSASIPLVVMGATGTTGPNGDFAVSFDASAGTALMLPPTGTATATVDLTAINGFMGDISLSVNGFPLGTWGTLSSYYAPVGMMVTLTASSVSAAPGTGTIIITAMGSSGSHTATILLVVTEM